MSKIHRVTISVPRALRERMEAVKGQVNWSAVAARAFEAKLLAIEAANKRGAMSKQEVIKRLRASNGLEGREEYEEGKQAGRRWAESLATLGELRRLDDY